MKTQNLTPQTQKKLENKRQLTQLLKTQKIQTIKLKVIRRTRGSSQLPSYLVILWLKTLKAGKCHAVLAKLS